MRRPSNQLHHRNLPLLLLRARERVIAHFRPILNAHGVTEQQWRIVRVLLQVPALEPREIGEICGLSSPSLVGILARMQQVGLIKRRPVKHDQRRVSIALTREARALAARMAPEIDAAYSRIAALTGPHLFEQLHRTLDQLLTILELPHVSQARGPAR